MTKLQIDRTIITVLAFHLLYTNTLLLASVNPTMIGWLFAFIVLFASSYSALTAVILDRIPNWWLFIVAAILDGLGVLFEYGHFSNQVISVYFSVYTALIVIAIGFLKLENKAKDLTSEKLLEANGRLKTQAEEIEKLKAENSNLSYKNERMSIDNEELTEKAEQLKQVIRDVDKAKETLKLISTENTELISKNNGLKDIAFNLKKENEKTVKDKQYIEDRLKKITSEHNQTKELHSKLLIELKKLKQLLDNQNIDLERLNEDKERQGKELSELKKDKDRLQKALPFAIAYLGKRTNNEEYNKLWNELKEMQNEN